MKPKKRWLFPLLALSLLWAAPTAQSAVRTVSVHGKTCVQLNHLAPYYGMKTTRPANNRIRLQNKWHTLEFETDSRRCWVNGTLLWMNTPLRKNQSQWTLLGTDFFKTVEPAIRPYVYLKNAGHRIVVLDPGHGGKDTGAVSPRKVYEKLLTKNIANRVRKLLQRRGVTVYLTRESDTYITLSQRCQIAARRGADVFVSLHADSASSKAEGAGTFILSLPGHYSTHSYGQDTPPSTSYPGNRYNLANQALGASIQQHLIHSTRQTDRGVKRARFQVLREAPCPAALVEMAFITNPKEEKFVLSTRGQEQLARGISDGIADYLNQVKRAKK